jgi:hypothetical protein
MKNMFYKKISMFCLIFRISNSHSCATRASTRKKALGQYLQTREFGESSQNCLANVGQSGESSQKCLANVGESGESLQNCLANVGESREYASTCQSAHDKVCCFMHKKHFICIKQSGLHSLNLPKSPNSRNTCQTHHSRVW